MGRKRRMGRRKRGGLAAAVKKVMMQTHETKRNIEELTAQGISTTVQTYEMTDIGTGDGSGARDGNQIYVRSLYGRLTVGLHASATASVVRMLVYTPRDADTLLTTIDYVERIPPEDHTVWLDKLITVNTDTPVKVVTLSKKWWNRRIPGMKTQYNSGSTTGSTTKNPVVIAFVSNETTNTPALNGDIALYYKDL